MVFQNEGIKELLRNTRVLWALSHAMALLSWDAETYMPKNGVGERSLAMGELSVLSQKILLDKKIVSLVDKLGGEEGLNDYENGVIRVLKRDIKMMKALPPELVRDLAQTTQEARPMWRQAKDKNNFNIFKPYLEKIIELEKKVAEYLGYKEHPYDALLDYYEEGLKTRDVDDMFTKLEPEIRKIMDDIFMKGYYPRKHELEETKYDVDEMRCLNKKMLEILGYPFDTARIDESAHPFTIHMGIKDVRITTRYEGYDFKRSLFSTIHEFGHALYELQIDESLKTTPIGTGVSLGIHESQSRFWENMIGRSMEFAEAIHPIIKKYLPFTSKYSYEELYKYFNTVKPSFIRTEADEVTYNIHILLRYRLEKLLVAGEIKVSEVPELWDEETENLLGIRPKTHSEGVLQDIHWSQGSIGYFPTYTIGNIVSAQIRYYISNDLASFYNDISNLEFNSIKNYLREKIHRWGSAYEPKMLLKKSFGESMNAKYFIEYLKDKYL